jgi:predicted ATPase/DNA-binding SARP family transcriptional activator
MEFHILGPLEVVADGEVLALGGPRQRAVLALLLLRPNAAVPRTQILDAVWGDDAPRTAIGSLQVYIHGLRQAIGAARIETKGSTYRLQIEPGELDLDQFDAAVERARAALANGNARDASADLAAALALWRGPALADLAEHGEAQAAARELDERRLAALELQNDAWLALGRGDLVLAGIEREIETQPFRERFRAQLILALYRAGRQTDALAAYQAMRATWADELGIEPTPALKELERAVLQHDPALAAPEAERRRQRLPVPATPLVGRRLEIAAVTALFRSEEARLVTLVGAGGTGKTRLALAVAEALGAELRDGAAFVDLSAVTDPELLLPTIAQAFGAQHDGDVLGPLTDQLRGLSLLVVLDNLEQILAGTGPLANLLSALPELRILATSRSPLRLSHERTYPVPPLPLPVTDEPEELAANEAVNLFRLRARAVDASFELDEATSPKVAAICRQLDGLPRAIELAAARANVLRPGELLGRLEDEHELLASAPRDAPVRQSTLARTIQWSYDLLASDEQDAFARLAVFAGGCTVQAAERVCETDINVLASLIDNSLVRRRQPEGVARLVMLETVRRYALDRLAERDDEHVRQRHAEWLVEVAETAEENLLAGGDPVPLLDELEREHDNIRAALAWALATPSGELALRLAASLRPYWEVRGHLNEGRRWLAEAIAAHEHAPPALRAKAVGVSGTLAFHSGDLSAAESFFSETLALFRELGDRDGIARGLSDLGTVAAAVGDLERAGDLLGQSAEQFRELGEQKRLAIALANLGHVAGQRSDFATAARVTAEALSIQAASGDKQRQAVSLLNLGSFSLRTGDSNEAHRWYRECLTLAVELGYKEVIAYGLVAVIRLSLLADEPRQAALLAGVADAVLAESGVELLTGERDVFEEAKASTRQALGDEAFAAAHAEGLATAVHQALDDAGFIASSTPLR